MEPKLSEQEHKQYLDWFLEGIRDLKQGALEKTIPDILPYIQDNLKIARDEGYRKLADRYASLFKDEGLVFEF